MEVLHLYKHCCSKSIETSFSLSFFLSFFLIWTDLSRDRFIIIIIIV